MNYFDSAIGLGNGILSVHYQIREILQKLRGKCVNFLCSWPTPVRKMNNLQRKLILQYNKLSLIPEKTAKTFPPYFFHGHLLHRLYGADAPDYLILS